jgi:hypothetical protein
MPCANAEEEEQFMSSADTARVCLACGCSEDQAPLIALHYRGQRWHICSQHLPLLIHEPQLLMGRLPGAEQLPATEHHHD